MCNEVSLCMIVKNEEDYLSRCLESVKDVVDEIIIVDTGSTDRTVEIAERFGAKIYYFAWNSNFSEARNISLKYATKDWILILDADDELKFEYKNNLKLLLNSQLDDKAVYFFQTINYYGNKIDENCITVNLNPRLFKNRYEIHYEGEIHNQLIHSDNEYDAVYDAVKIHHYGYLDKSIAVKDKRNRNISILMQNIKKEPDNMFNYFNLGNEYTALDDSKKALECYYKAYEDFDPQKGFSSIMLLRIIISNFNLHQYNEALHFIDIASSYYPKFTDVYFFKALVYSDINKPMFEIKALEKCIEIGEPSSELKFLCGCGSFKAYHELGNVYMRLGDCERAFNYYKEAIKSKPNYMEPIYSITKILRMKNVEENELKNTVENLFSDQNEAYKVMADMFYNDGYYKISLEYIEKCKKINITTDSIIILKAKCFIRMGAFDECIDMDIFNEEFSFYLQLSMYRVLSCILKNKISYASSILSNFNEAILTNMNKKLLEVYSALVKLFRNESIEILSEDENEREYLIIILEICEILLVNMKFDELKIAVNLLNLVNNKLALISLGKLYYNYGYDDIAKKEILRSIKEFDIYDNESLDILKK